MHIIKNVKLYPAQGGYIITVDKCKKGSGEYDGVRYIGEHKIVVEDPAKAMDIVDELYEASMEGMEIMLESYEEGGSDQEDTNLMNQE